MTADRILVWLCLCLLPATTAWAADKRTLQIEPGTGQRLALVIGNSAYKNGPLGNPVNDARAVAAKLQTLGFDVIKKENFTAREIGGVYREFGSRITPGGVALVFYAGHGVQFKGQNYFPAIDADLAGEEDVPQYSLHLATLLDKMEEAKAGVSLVLLDACRDNPFARRFRSAARGLAKVEAASGTLIHYATKPGSVASDGDGQNGTYTEALLKQMDMPGIPIEQTLKRVTNQVVGMTAGKQEPWIEGSLRGEFFFKPADGSQIAQLGPGLSPTTRTAEQIEDELWDAIRHSDKPSVFEEYMKQYPKGRYLAQARVRLAGLKAPPPPTASTTTPAVRPASSSPEDALWAAVEKGNTAEDYDAYLGQYPKGKYLALAKSRKARLQEQAQQQEQQAWAEAEAKASLESFGDYLSRYPSGQFATLAGNRIRKLKDDAAALASRREKEAQDAEEAKTWARIENSGDKQALTAYLSRYPTGRNTAAAREKLDKMAKEEAESSPGKVFKDCDDCPEMVIIPPGSFQMGSEWGWTIAPAEMPGRHVTIRSSFAIGKTEVTQAQWRALMGSNPSHFSRCGDTCPVERVSWHDAQDYVQKLIQKTGRNYRLPTEAEWEYSCLAGYSHEHCGSDTLDEVAWDASNSDRTTHPVAKKKANAWGLFDMNGNVYEWVQDCFFGNFKGAPIDGSAWTSGECSERVLRSGSWVNGLSYARSRVRHGFKPTSRMEFNGFRVVRSIP